MTALEQIKRTLVWKLTKRGMAPGAIPLFIRGLAASLKAEPAIGIEDLNRRMRRMGWSGVRIDRDDLAIAISCFDATGLENVNNKPARWFFKEFEAPCRRMTSSGSNRPFDTDPAFF